jgi:hypothetical protein
VIASVVCGSGSSVGVGCVDMQVRCGVIFALGHCVLHFPGTNLDVAHAVFHGSFEDAVQSCTSPQDCFKTELSALLEKSQATILF